MLFGQLTTAMRMKVPLQAQVTSLLLTCGGRPRVVPGSSTR